MINLAQIGCGYWGPNLLRNFDKLDNVRVKYVAEKSKDRKKFINTNYKNIEVIESYDKILEDKEVDAVVVATEAENHYKHAKEMLSAGKHCFVEKPLAMKTDEARELTRLAESNGLTLMVGHTFLYNSAVRKVKEEIDKGTLGKVYYIYAQRLNLGRVRRDINSMWNFAPHDISICLYLIDSEPEWVNAIGLRYIQKTIEDVVFLTVGFKNGVIAHMHLSWLDPNKIRKMTVVGSKKMIVYDDVSDYKVQIFDKGIDKMDTEKTTVDSEDFAKFQLVQRAGDLLIPKVSFIEPLATETKHFIDCITTNSKPISDGVNGIMVTEILEAGMDSLAKKGTRIELKG